VVPQGKKRPQSFKEEKLTPHCSKKAKKDLEPEDFEKLFAPKDVNDNKAPAVKLENVQKKKAKPIFGKKKKLEQQPHGDAIPKCNEDNEKPKPSPCWYSHVHPS